ncbi:MFS transporter [Acidocella sp.]|uniref:MFS transporter n=1 Tax=Acidocella sp. TaxID=50710 RepID=UPI003CFBEFEC
MEGELQPRAYSHAERLRVIHGVLLCVLLAAIDQTVVLPAIPQMARTLHGTTHLSWVVSAYLLTATATTPIHGKLSDQFGRAKILIPCLLIFILASMVCASAGSVPMLLLGRALQGMGGGALLAVSQSAVADVVPPRERGRYQAWFASIWALASGAGPVVGGYIAQHLSWRFIFWANLPLGALALALCLRGLPNLPVAGRRARIDIGGALLLMGSTTLLLCALSLGGVDLPWLSWREAALVLLALAGFALFGAQQRRAAHPLLPGSLLLRLRLVVALAWLNTSAMFAAIFMFPLLLQQFFHAAPARAGIALVPFLLSGAAGAYAAGQTTRRTGWIRPIFVMGLTLASLGFALMAAAPLARPVAVSALLGFGLGMLNPTTLIAAQSLAKVEELGIATGMLLLLRAMGGAFGATLAGAALDGGFHDPILGYRLGFAFCLALTLCGLLIMLRAPEIKLRGGPD